MNILVVCAHPDDELLGCGGTIRRLADEGHSIFTAVLCGQADARFGRPDDATLRCTIADAESRIGIADSLKYDYGNIRFNTVPHIELVQAVEKAIVRFEPEWVFTHHPGDLNVDHRVCHEATMAAVMLPQRLSTRLSPDLIKRVYLFEVLSSTDWAAPTARPFIPNSFFRIDNTLEAKIETLSAFEGALKAFPHSRSREAIEHLARVRGVQVGVTAAEAFNLVRDVN